ncbi:MAG: helicase-related protein [Bacillota bacterium]|nr:helicase-related protein [Bacillota bacterium]
MKKAQRASRDFERLRSQFKQIEEIVNNTRNSNLWKHEASVRKKIKSLKDLKDKGLKDYDIVYEDYIGLLNYISQKLIELYNRRNNSSYEFEDIIKTDMKGYISSGIMSVLIKSHIPNLVAAQFEKYFPDNPKDEFEDARKIKRKFFLHLGATNTGKTYNALERLKTAENGVYLAPLRILALENFEKLNRDGVPCDLLTGEEEIDVADAKHVSSTIEKLDLSREYDIAVIDEIQMIENSQRGQAWTRALLGLKCPEIHVCGALNAKELILKIIEDCGDEAEVREYHREIPLKLYDKSFELKTTVKGDALVVFSKRRVLELSKFLNEKGVKNSVIYGDLPPEVRRMQYDAFISGENGVLVTTDAIGMGVNLPIRRIIFMDIKKFDGEDFRYLTTQEVKQIGGRAGRKGIYEVGFVGVYGPYQPYIRECLETPDDELLEAVVGPSETILKIGNLPLNEKLALWSTRQEKLDYYRKMDVSDYLLILDSIKRYKLPEEIQYRLMKLPFDVGNPEILASFVDYVDEIFRLNKSRVTKPLFTENTLSDLEIYYQKINLYYSFSKNLKLSFNEQWVYDERKNVSEKINELLLKL